MRRAIIIPSSIQTPTCLYMPQKSKPRTNSEDRECYDLMQWCRSLGDQIPQLKPPRIYHITNEGKRTPRNGAKLRAMGLCKGVPDYFWMYPYASMHGIYIEMKTDNGEPSEDQIKFMLECTEAKYLYILGRGWIQTARLMCWHLLSGKTIGQKLYDNLVQGLR